MQHPPLLFIETTPHAVPLSDNQRVLQAGLNDDASATDGFGALSLQAARADVSRRKKQLGVELSARSP